MNTNGIAKLYTELTPRERVPLILAAVTRGDEAERLRLVDAAPRSLWRMSDHVGCAMALQTVSRLHVVHQLELLTDYWHATTRVICDAMESDCEDDARSDAEAPDKSGPRPRGACVSADSTWPMTADLSAFRFCVNSVAWEMFCEGLNADPRVIAKFVSDDPILDYCTSQMPANAPSAEEILQRWPEMFPKPKRIVTAAGVLKFYRDVFEDTERDWT